MARDYENMHNIEELDDRELRDLVREQFAEHAGLDADDLTVLVSQGMVTLSGRVGTEGERNIAEHILTDVLGVTEFTNDLVVDEVRRGESSQAADEHVADEESEGGLLGDRAVPFTDESAHLADVLDDELAGTTDMQRVMEDGMTWNPPDGPTPEGSRGTDAGPEEMGGRH